MVLDPRLEPVRRVSVLRRRLREVPRPRAAVPGPPHRGVVRQQLAAGAAAGRGEAITAGSPRRQIGSKSGQVAKRWQALLNVIKIFAKMNPCSAVSASVCAIISSLLFFFFLASNVSRSTETSCRNSTFGKL